MNRRDFVKTNLLGALGLACASSSDDARAHEDPPQPSPALREIKTGGARLIPIHGGKYHVWTKRVGAGPVKMLTLHGGPGVTHEYFECFEDFLPQQGIQFYYYDQLGSAYSDQPADSSLWTLPRFVEEVEEVRRALQLHDFYLYGQSWGALLAIEYALKYGANLKGLILSNMTASIPAYEKHAAELRRALPPEITATLDQYEAKSDFNNPKYQQAMDAVYSRHLCRLPEWPEPASRCLRHLNPQVYNTMQGPNEFVITGNLKTWDRWADLPRISVPTLVLGARYDTMSIADLERESRLIPNARLAVCENGSHFSLYDDQDAYFGHLLAFIRGNELGRKIR